MLTLPLTTPTGVLVKTTCVDYPGLVAGAFFLKGCNIRCPYCYNIGLVLGERELQNRNDFSQEEFKESLSSVQDLFNLMEKRQGILKGIVISGGEPLVNPFTPIIIKKAKSLGYKVKLDTNGTLPEELQAFLENNELHPDFIAMDIKTSPERYAEVLCPTFSKFFGKKDYWQAKLKKSAEIVASLPKDSREFRSVLVPTLIKKEDIEKISRIIPKDASWQFAQFLNKNCLDPSYNNITPYSDKEIKELIDYAKSLIPGAELR